MMITRNQTQIKTFLILASLTLAVCAVPALAAVPVPTGVNPATGSPWANGDMYRLVFITSTNPGCTYTDIDDYNALVQGLADASTAYDIGADDGVTWKVIGSTSAVDARDNTSTNPDVETGCPILLLDGTTLVANDNADLWDGSIQHIINLTETGATKTHWPFTGTWTDGTLVTGHPSAGQGLDNLTGEVSQGRSDITTEWIYRIWTSDPAATSLPFYAMSDPLVVGGGGPTNISPENGSTVPVGNVELLWENMDPNFAGGSVYVDVWFGTEPNELDPGYDMTKVVDAGENTTTVQVTAPTEGTYYWKVGNYIYGSATGDPCEGDVWSFNTLEDLQPSSVDAGDNMITWSGQPVSLNATVVDDGKSALTYAWTADPPDGVVFSDPAIEDPTVTITKVASFTPFVANGGFEDPVLADGTTVYVPSVPAWIAMWSQGTWTAHDYRGGAYNPTAGEFDYIPDGDNVGWVWIDADSDHCLYQETGVTIEAGKTYVLSAMVGNSSANGGLNANHHIELVGASLAAASASTASPDPNEWAPVTVTYIAGADESADPNVGQPLGIRLVGEKHLAGYELQFDQVVLTVDGQAGDEVYDPSMSTVTLTLAVNDEANPIPVEGTMTIDVYDNACLAALGIGLTIDPTDFDGNCITDIRDYAVFAAKWLFDIALTAPVVKP